MSVMPVFFKAPAFINASVQARAFGVDVSALKECASHLAHAQILRLSWIQESTTCNG